MDDGDAFTQQQTVLETNREDEEDGDGIRASDNDLEKEIVEMEAEIDAILDNLTSMKDHINLDAQSKKPSLSNFWSAASVLGKKWHKWRRKQKKSFVTLPISPETQSEVADYGFSRRSCDIGPRFSLDVSRVSFDQPVASLDGYLFGRRLPENVQMSRSDMQIPVEQPTNPDDIIPGGTIQTREYYLHSSSKRWKSLDRSNSIPKMAMDEWKSTAAKVSPATVDHSHIHGRRKFRTIGGDQELERDSNSNSNWLRNHSSETLNMGFRYHENKEVKKSRWWLRWFTRSGAAESWEDPRREENGGLSYGFNAKLHRSISSVSWMQHEETNFYRK